MNKTAKITGILSLMLISFGAGIGIGKYQPKKKSEPMFYWDNKPVFQSELKPEFNDKLKALQNAKQESDYVSNMELYRETKRILDLAAMERYVSEQSKLLQITKEEAAKKILATPAANAAEARFLFEASDPSTPMKEFDRLRPELENYITDVRRKEKFDSVIEDLLVSKKLTYVAPRPQHVLKNLQIEGFPVVGSPQAKQTVVWFMDYLCRDCADYNVKLLEIMSKVQDVKFVLVPYPYSSPERTLAFARGSLCASELGKFLDYHTALIAYGDKLKEVTPFVVAENARIPIGDFYGCYKKGTGVAEFLARVQSEAKRAGVIKLPSVLLNGKMYEGKSSLPQLAEALKVKL